MSLKEFRCSAILFDLDGVLVDSTPSVGRVWRAWAERHRIDPDATVKAAHGRRSIETIRALAPHLDAEAENQLVEQAEIDDKIDLGVIPGAPELLAVLPEHLWAIVTSGTRPLATSRIAATGLPFPRVLVSGDEVSNGKPHPEPYLRGAELLGVPPEQCLVFEDTPAGIAAASSAGMQAIALATTYPPGKLAAAQAIVRDYNEMTVTLRASQIAIAVRA